MAKKGENIRKRNDGRWEARIIIGYKENGAPLYHSLYDKTYKGVKEKRNTYLQRNIVFSATVNNDTKFYHELLIQWLANKQLLVKQSTYAHYHNLIQRHIMPALGHYPLSKLNKEIIDAFLKHLMHHGRVDGSGGLASKTIMDIRSIIKSTITFAQECNYPVHVYGSLFSPPYKKKEIQVLTYQEQDVLEKYLLEHPTTTNIGIFVTLYTGLRIGELCALTWDNVDFSNQCINIEKTLIRIQDMSISNKKTKLFIDKPKTQSSIRKIPLPCWLIDYLYQYRNEDNCYVLSGTQDPIESRLCFERYKKIMKDLGLPSYSFHTLRHTFATRCVEIGFDVKSLSEILGHSSINMTLSRYVHPSLEVKRKQMNLLSRIDMGGQVNGQ